MIPLFVFLFTHSVQAVHSQYKSTFCARKGNQDNRLARCHLMCGCSAIIPTSIQISHLTQRGSHVSPEVNSQVLLVPLITRHNSSDQAGNRTCMNLKRVQSKLKCEDDLFCTRGLWNYEIGLRCQELHTSVEGISLRQVRVTDKSFHSRCSQYI